MGSKRGINQACAIFKNNPKKGYTPREIEILVNRDKDLKDRFKEGTGRTWVRNLKKRGIIRKTGSKYYLDSKQKALDYLEGKRGESESKGGLTPRAYEGYQIIQTPMGIRTVERHLKKLIGNVTYPKEIVKNWVSMGILKPINPSDPAKQAIYENPSFKAVISLKSYKGSFYIKADDYKESAEEVFGSGFRQQIENLQASQHSGIIAKDLIGYKYRNNGLELEIDSGSREGMVEAEFKGEEDLVENATQKMFQESVDATVIESKILKSLEDMERRHTREMHSISTVLSRVVESMGNQNKIMQSKLTDFNEGLGKISEQLTAIHTALNLKPSESLYKPLGDDERKDVV